MSVQAESQRKIEGMLQQDNSGRVSGWDFDYVADCLGCPKLSRRKRERIDALYRKYVEEWL
jgi:hypothetical protein